MSLPVRRLTLLDSGNIGRTESLRSVLGTADHGPVTVLDPLATVPPTIGPTALREHATILARTLDATGGDLYLVTHCMNAALAYELATALTQTGSAPAGLLLFAPAKVDRTLMAYQATELLRGLGLPQAPAKAFAEEVWRHPESIDRALGATRERMVGLAQARAASLGLDEEESESFVTVICERYDQWLLHLAGQISFEPHPAEFPVDLVGSSAQDGLSPGILTAQGPRARFHPCTDPQGFREPAVQRLFAEIVAGSPQAPAGSRAHQPGGGAR